MAVFFAHADRAGPGDDRPLVKDKYGSERRKAKTLNFSIAYGKTAHGLAKVWHSGPLRTTTTTNTTTNTNTNAI